jgi:UDP-N-acetylmuramoyl-L-alanyl-D-glutamate--2,6-diaminopimelate ligase
MEIATLPSLLAGKVEFKLPEAVNPDLSFYGVTEDSRRVRPGDLFVAAPGARQDGNAYADSALAVGAVAILGEKPAHMFEGPGGRKAPYLHAAIPRRALGLIAHALLGDPTQTMNVIGITGTNGKTSTARITQHILNTNARSAACFGTLSYAIGGEEFEARHTTPFGEDLARLFGQAKAAGHAHVVMEASSHALEQERVAGIRFNVGAFTNLTQDHLDFHRDMASYLRAKVRLFEMLQSKEGFNAFAAINGDDPASSEFSAATQTVCYTYGKRAEVRSSNVRQNAASTRFRLDSPWGACEITTPMLGRHNVSNVLCAITICGGLGVPLDGIARAVESAPLVPGRFEHVDAGQNFQVIVDYAHTDDGLKNVLSAARELCDGRVICVFGCGGDRDKTKRPKMGAVAAELADFTIITSDNPRSEEPERIILDIEQGIQRTGKRKDEDYWSIVDRRSAIHKAIEIAGATDLVLIAGKGHETYQILGPQRIHFDDREVAREALSALQRR